MNELKQNEGEWINEVEEKVLTLGSNSAVTYLVARWSHMTPELPVASLVTEKSASCVLGWGKNTGTTICNMQSANHITLKFSGESHHPTCVHCTDPTFFLTLCSWFTIYMQGRNTLSEGGEKEQFCFSLFLNTPNHQKIKISKKCKWNLKNNHLLEVLYTNSWQKCSL